MEIDYPLISVIIPVYNTEKYLPDCINSIIRQSYQNLEIILVNDGSKDNSGRVCDEFASKDRRIGVIHQINQGVTKARANGVEYCAGEYLSFVDSDDYLREDAIETMYSKMRPDYDVVSFESLDIKTLSPKEYAEALLKNSVNWSLCSKLYRRSIFENNVFRLSPDITAGEDFLTQLILAGELRGRVAYYNDKKYCYRINTDSVMSKHQYNMKYELRMLTEVRKVVDSLEYDIEEACYIHSLNVLGGLIAHQQPVDYKGEWVQYIYNNAGRYILSFRQKCVIIAVENKMMRGILVLEKKIKKIIKRLLLRKGTR